MSQITLNEMTMYQINNFGSKYFETQGSRKNITSDLGPINVDMFPEELGNVS